MGIEAIVPLKAFSSTKQRFAGVLPAAARLSMVRATAGDVLTQFRAHPLIDNVSIVSG